MSLILYHEEVDVYRFQCNDRNAFIDKSDKFRGLN